MTIEAQLSSLFSVEAGKRYFIRFGDVPKTRRSKVWNAPNVYYHHLVDSELPGFSVFEVRRHPTRKKLWDVVTDPLRNHGLSSLADLIYDAEKKHRDIYLLTGKPLTWRMLTPEQKKEFADWYPGKGATNYDLEGTDGEPLLIDHEVVKKITVRDIICKMVEFDPDDLEVDAHLVEARNPVPPLPAPVVRKAGVEPALMTWDEYIAAVNPKQKWHESHAYNWGMEELNRREPNGQLWESADIKNYKTLLRRVRSNGIRFEYRLWKQEHATGYTEFTIGIFNEQGERVGTAQDEWGALLIAIAREYRGFGLSTLLTHFAHRFEPGKDTGGTTNAGHRAIQTFHREAVRQALVSGQYSELIRARKLTRTRVLDIIKSAQLNLRSPKNTRDLGPSPRDKWLIYAEAEYGAFVLFDPKFRLLYNTGDANAEWAEKMIYAAVNCYVLNDRAVIFTLFGGVDTRAKKLMVALAGSFAAVEKLPLYLDPEDVQFADPDLFEIAKNSDMTTGFRRFAVQIKDPADLKIVERLSRLWLRQHDQYDELKNGILEVSYAKFRQAGVQASTKLTLEEFMVSPLRNAYVRYKNLESYVRKSRRIIEGRQVTVLERGSTKNRRRPANMEVNPKHKKTGLYREFDDLCEKLARQHGYGAILVENVLNDFLPAVLTRYGYKKMPQMPGFEGLNPDSYYKLLNPVVESNMKNVVPDFGHPGDRGSRTAYRDGATVFYSVLPNLTVDIQSVRVPRAKRGQGLARAALDMFCREADSVGFTLKLLASPLDTKTRLDKLVAFYRSLGFEVAGRGNYAGEPIMVRSPKKNSVQASSKFDSAKDLIERWMTDMFTERKTMTVQERKDYGHSVLGKCRGLTAKQVTVLYNWIEEFATNWRPGRRS